MACTRGCTGVPICSALDLCCIQFNQDCGTQCTGVPVGFSTIQINAAGHLEVCSNLSGVCTCEELREFDCTDLNTCSLDDLGDVDTTGVSVGDYIVWDGANWVVVTPAPVTQVDTFIDNSDGTFTHTSTDGTIVTIDLCDLRTGMDSGSAWSTLTLEAGWAAEAGMQVPEIRCRCDGQIELRGCMQGTVTGGEIPPTIAILPATLNGNNCRPSSNVRFQAGSSCATIEISTVGVVTTNQIAQPDTRCFDGQYFYDS